MYTLYTFNIDKIFSGSIQVTNIFDPVPAGTSIKPPTLKLGEIAYWKGDEWVTVLAEGIPHSGPTLEEIKTAKRAEIDHQRDIMIARGLSYVFPDGLGTMEIRSEVDMRNISGRALKGLVLVVADDTTTLLPFRDQEDVTHMLTGQEAVDMGDAVDTWVSDHYVSAWSHKAAMDALETAEAVQRYDCSGGWPE